MVRFVSRRPFTVRPLRLYQIELSQRIVRGSAGIGTRSDPLPTVHGGLAAADRIVRPASTSVRRRHADLRFLPACCYRTASEPCVCVRRRRRIVDEVEPAAAERRQDGSHVVLVGPPSASDTVYATDCRTECNITSTHSTRSRNFYRF